MAVYRFRVFIEDDHEVFRDVEVQGKHRFADLHQTVVSAFNLQKGQPAEYISSDQSWYEGDTVVELDENLEGDHQKIVSHINEPHQRFLCITQSFNELGLALELQRILKEQDGITYPVCVKSEGEPPYYTQPPPEPIVDEPEEVEALEESLDMFAGEGPSEEEIEKLEKEAEAAVKSGKLKAPKVDINKLEKESKKRQSQENDKKEEGFGDFNMDDLM